jgi:hypothetical protein
MAVEEKQLGPRARMGPGLVPPTGPEGAEDKPSNRSHPGHDDACKYRHVVRTAIAEPAQPRRSSTLTQVPASFKRKPLES